MLLAYSLLLFLVKCVCPYFFAFFFFQTDNMAREGLRTLVVAKKQLTDDQYRDFEVSYKCLRFIHSIHITLSVSQCNISVVDVCVFYI